MDYFRFFLNNKKLISFGFFLTFFSSFGQTFLVSLYVPGISKEFELSSGSFGTLYGAATVLSGICLVYSGRLIDRCNLRNYTMAAIILLIASCFCISFSSNMVFIFVGFWGLRFAGQGLFSHISSTSISKFFDQKRGTALSLSVMGYSMGEACFPYSLGLIISLVGWRYSMSLNGILISATLLPFIFVALNEKRHRIPVEAQKNIEDNRFSSFGLWLDKRFIIVVTAAFIIPFMTTGLFFHQLRLAGEKEWAVQWLTGSFLGYALGRTLSSLISGKLIDKLSALKVFPFHLIPFFAALCVLIFFDHPLAAPVYLTLTGITMGLSSTTHIALLAEIYGTENLGSIKAMSTTAVVFGTALSPAIFGFILDQDLNFQSILIASACIVALIILISGRLAYYVDINQNR